MNDTRLYMKSLRASPQRINIKILVGDEGNACSFPFAKCVETASSSA